MCATVMKRAGTVAGIVGWPVAQSLSPRLHSHWLKAHGIDGAYVALPVPRERFATALSGLAAAGLAGANVTIPHKEAAFAVAHTLDDAAHATGAVNLLLFRDGRYHGRNTDVAGLETALREALGQEYLAGRIAIVLGAGGGARAATLACDRIGASAIAVLNRHPGRAETLVRSMRTHVRATLHAFGWTEWTAAAKDAALVINATSAGMNGVKPLPLALDPLPADAAICDIVYKPLETDLLKRARARGHRTVDGLGMLLHQAVPAFEAFYGMRPAVTAALRAELEGALRHGA